MGEGTEAAHAAGGEGHAFFVVWSPQGGNPVVRHETFGRARHAAWMLAEKYPSQDFFVLKSCWGRRARTMEEPTASGEASAVLGEASPAPGVEPAVPGDPD